MGEVTAVGIHDDFTSGQTGITVGATDNEVSGRIDVDVGNIGNVKAVSLQHRSDDTFPDIAAQLADLKISAVHNRHDHSIDAHHITRFIILNADLGLAVGTEQIIGVDALGQTVAQGTGQRNGHGHQLGSLGTGTAKHHTLVTGTANLIICTQRNIRGLGVDTALDLYRVCIEAVTGVNIADLTDGFPGNRRVIHHSLCGDLTADQAEVSRNHGLTGNTGVGILCQAGIQDRIGDGVGNFVGVAVGNTFGGKQSFFHFRFLSQHLSSVKNKNRTPKIRCALYRILIFRMPPDLAP